MLFNQNLIKDKYIRKKIHENIKIVSWPSEESCRVSIEPTLPSPAIMIFIGNLDKLL